jgi:hypothetical protein
MYVPIDMKTHARGKDREDDNLIVLSSKRADVSGNAQQDLKLG